MIRTPNRRRGHMEILPLLVILTLLVSLIMDLIGFLIWGGAKLSPPWYKLLSFAINPATITITMLIVVWGCIGTWIGAYWLELQAERIGLAVWQFEREKFAGLALGLYKRIVLVVVAMLASATTAAAWNGGWPSLLQLSFSSWNLVGLIAGVYLVIIVLLTAQLSNRPARKMLPQF